MLENNIIRIEASSNYCRIFFNNEKPLLVAKVLHWFQDHLEEDMFCRIHRSHLVNRTHVCEIKNSILTLSNGDKVQMSRRKRHAGDLILKLSA